MLRCSLLSALEGCPLACLDNVHLTAAMMCRLRQACPMHELFEPRVLGKGLLVWQRSARGDMPEASLVASSVVLAIDAHANRCCTRVLEVLDWPVRLGRGAASGRMHFRMRVIPPVIMSWTVCLSLLIKPLGLPPPASK
jgi:hypothetical protein